MMRASTASSIFVFAILAASILSIAIPLQAQQSVTPMSHPRIRGSSDAESTNWSGYAVTAAAGTVTNAEGSWTVPTASCSSTSSYAAFWVGIDGYSSDTVEQTGTMVECAHGTASYYAWYEFYPSPSYEIGTVVVSPGDEISASVTYSGGGSFTVTIMDVTTGKSYSTSATVSSAQESSAEWITEAPSSGSMILPLANFGTVYCGSDYTAVSSTDYATVSGVSGSISSFGTSVQEITMVSSSGATEAQPSVLTTDGTSFSVAWVSPSTTTTTSTTSTTSSTTSTTSSTTSTTSSTTTTTSTSSAPSLVVSVATNQKSYTGGSDVEITVSVTTSTGLAVSGARVTVTVTLPNGEKASGSGRTTSNGAADFVYRLSRNAPLGTYTVSATASASGYSTGSGSTTFTVT